MMLSQLKRNNGAEMNYISKRIRLLDKSYLLVIILISLTVSTSEAQLSKNQLQKLDGLVTSWNDPNAPGGTVGIMGNGKLLYTKSFGLASLDYDISNTENTLFNIGSISKQFTAMGIIKLDLAGRLSIDDDIRKYIQLLPDFGHKITIRHLLHHTSGLRDIHSILTLAGWRMDDPRSNDDLFRIMSNQKELNFSPGNEYMYSNTGYIFLARIIEVVTGVKFENWMKENIFEPLGMFNTYIESNATKVVKGNATSYNKLEGNNYSRAVEYWNYTGSGNVHTTVKNLLTWLNNFGNPQNKWEEAFNILQTTDALNNGKKNKYAFGVEIDTINGFKRVSHGGSVGSFRSFACSYPDKKLSIAVLTNYSNSTPDTKLNLLAEIINPELISNSNPNEMIYTGFTAITNSNLKKYEGDYWCDRENVARRIHIENDTLRYFRNKGNESPLQYVGNSEFIIMPKARFKTKFIFDRGQAAAMLVESKNSQDYYEAFNPLTITPKYLLEFVGKYYSPELNTYYNISFQKDTLIGYHPRHGIFKIEPLAKEDLFISNGPLQKINFSRDKNRKIIGMRVSFDRVKNLWLEKE
jgi:CubicO group peptidase (beta-lactamase class C family)